MFHFCGGMILVGVMAFRSLMLLPGFHGATNEEWQAFLPFNRRLNFIYLGSAAILFSSEIVLFVITSAAMSGESISPEVLEIVLLQTHFGTVFLVRAAIAFVLAAVSWLLWRNKWWKSRRRSNWEIVGGILTLAWLLSNAWIGHAAATNGVERSWRIGADAVHLFAAAVWPTGLLFFGLFLGASNKIGNQFNFRLIREVARRFSQVSFFTVGLLIISGILNAWFIVGKLSALLTTSYGQVLSLKLVLFGIMLCFAAWNRWRLVPLILNAPRLQNSYSVLKQLRSFVWAELGLALAIVTVVSVLGITPPPR